jgi:hypothetical protein
MWLVADLLPELAQTYHAQFIADAYWGSGALMGLPPLAERAALFEQLDALAGPSFHWDQQGQLIRLRSRSWFLERPREIPLRFVRQWREDHHRYGSLTFDHYLAMATRLTDLQLQHVGDLVNLNIAALPIDLGYDIRGAYPARFALRLYASLTPAQQQQLSAAGKLPVAPMTPAQQALFLAGLQEEPGPRFGPPPAPAQQEDEASFAVSGQRWVRTRVETGEGLTSYSERFERESGDQPGSGPSAGSSRPGLPAAGAASPPTRGAPAAAAVPGGAAAAPARPQPGRHSFTRVEFLLSGGSKERRSFSLSVAVP